MTFLSGRGWVDVDVRERYELETVARIRRVGNHPSFEAVIVAVNLVLARMANELDADAKGLPAPFPTVEQSIKQILRPLENGGAEAGLGKVYSSEASYRQALEAWAGIAGAFGDAYEALDERTKTEVKEACDTALPRFQAQENQRLFAPEKTIVASVVIQGHTGGVVETVSVLSERAAKSLETKGEIPPVAVSIAAFGLCSGCGEPLGRYACDVCDEPELDEVPL
jgi:hypothetical protein